MHILRKSVSKGKFDGKSKVGRSNVSAVIEDSVSYLRNEQSASRKAKRPSLVKKMSGSEVNSKRGEKLPDVHTTKVKKYEIVGDVKKNNPLVI